MCHGNKFHSKLVTKKNEVNCASKMVEKLRTKKNFKSIGRTDKEQHFKWKTKIKLNLYPWAIEEPFPCCQINSEWQNMCTFYVCVCRFLALTYFCLIKEMSQWQQQIFLRPNGKQCILLFCSPHRIYFTKCRCCCRHYLTTLSTVTYNCYNWKTSKFPKCKS